MAELPTADRHEVTLPPPPAEAAAALDQAIAEEDRRGAVAAVVEDHPTLLQGWAALSLLGSDAIERYAYARVGYHRGLDALRGAGWGGKGYVRWKHTNNHGFLRCLALLRRAADEIGETDEVERIDDFLRFLDPDWDDSNVD